MSTPLLLVATATTWLGMARMPRSLAMAGFKVALLAPKGVVAEKSRFVTTIGHLPDNATPLQWAYAFNAMVKATSPRLVLPCDDIALRLLMLLARSPPQPLPLEQWLQLSKLIISSLGDPAFYWTSIDKTMFSTAAEALGLRVPAHDVVATPEAAEPFIARHGYPVVLKRGHSTAGESVAICADDAEFRREFLRLLAVRGLVLDDAPLDRLVIQARVAGPTYFYSAAAWNGTLLAGFASEKITGTPMGPSSVARYFRSPEMRDATAKLTRGFGITGLFSPEFIVDERSGEIYVLELNRRISHGTHRGSLMNVDLGAALHAAMHGVPSPSRAELEENEEHRCAHFPQEWVRDPDSRYLREYEVDVPWDEPELTQALVEEALRLFKDGS
jgi:predicted ATP-grasp superfamily ATP-dependent carboligase